MSEGFKLYYKLYKLLCADLLTYYNADVVLNNNKHSQLGEKKKKNSLKN